MPGKSKAKRQPGATFVNPAASDPRVVNAKSTPIIEETPRGEAWPRKRPGDDVIKPGPGVRVVNPKASWPMKIRVVNCNPDGVDSFRPPEVVYLDHPSVILCAEQSGEITRVGPGGVEREPCAPMPRYGFPTARYVERTLTEAEQIAQRIDEEAEGGGAA